MKNPLHNHWSRHASVYQMYPLSFRDASGDGRGDLRGILEKIDYLNTRPAKATARGETFSAAPNSLGIGAVWICPFYKSPMADFGYDVEDYTAIDPTFGTMADFEKLVSELHVRNIKVIIDFVGNHTSSRHPWFAESRATRHNPRRNWYVWRDGKKDPVTGADMPPTNWVSVFGGSAWELDTTTGQYYLHSFLKEQPDLNWHNAEVRAAMAGVIDFWVGKGVDGLRIDALQHFLEDENGGDDPINPAYNQEKDQPYQSLIHRFSTSDARKMDVIGTFLRDTLEKHRDLFIIGEVYLGTDELVRLYELCPNGRFAPFNFNLVGLPWNATDWKRVIDTYQARLKPEWLPNYTLGNHDIARVATRLGEAQAALAAFLQFTLPGMPFIYYGDELGMTNGTIEKSAIRDVLGKMFPTLHSGRDLERTPMQWDDSPHAGFSSAKPWLPVTTDYRTKNVAHELDDHQSMLTLYKSLIRLRNDSETLRLGTYVAKNAPSEHIFSFERHHGHERLLVLANFSDSIAQAHLPPSPHTPRAIFSTHAHRGVHFSGKTVELMPYEGYVISV